MRARSEKGVHNVAVRHPPSAFPLLSEAGFEQEVGSAVKRSRGKAFSPPQRGGVARNAGVVLFKKSTLLNEPPRRSAAPRLGQQSLDEA